VGALGGSEARVVVGADYSPGSAQLPLPPCTTATGQATWLTTARLSSLPLRGLRPEHWSKPSITVPNDATWKHGAEQLPARVLGALPAEGASIACGPLRAGHPAAAPIEVSNDAGPVVVGNHGAGAAVSRLLGSVSQKVARQATVPAVAVHSHDGGPASPEGRAGTP
jgi:nucleotide-binding universal stress UspA family protein